MANPYHDAAGRFCSKGEMLADIKKLSQTASTFNEYVALRKDYDKIQLSQNLSNKEKIEDAIDNRVRLRTDTVAHSIQSYELVKDKLSDDLGESGVRSLLETKNLPQEMRNDVIARGNAMDLVTTIEYASHHDGTLSLDEYKAILKREDGRDFAPSIAKSYSLSMEEKKKLINDSVWGNVLLATHNQKEFFKDKSLIQQLRNNTNLENEKDIAYVYGALADSPFDEDQKNVIESEYLHANYPTPSMTLARNPHLSNANAQKLLRKQIELGYAPNSHLIEKAQQYRRYPEFSYRRKNKKVKFRYTDDSLTSEKREIIEKRIKKLESLPSKTPYYDHEKEYKLSYLEGMLYANDKDYRRALKESKREGTKTEEGQKLARKVQSAKNLRHSYWVLSVLEKHAK